MSTLTASSHARRDRFADWAVIVLVVIALAAGWLIKSSAENATQSINSAAGSFSYPSGWQTSKALGLSAQDTRTKSGIPTAFSITSEALDTDQGLDALSTRQTMRLAQDNDDFSMLNINKETIGGDNAVTLSYAYVAMSNAGTAASDRLPVVVEATDTLIKRGNTLYVLRFSADSTAYASLSDLRAKLLSSVKLP